MKNFGDPGEGLIGRTVDDEELRHFGLPALVDLGLRHGVARGLVILGLQVANQEPVIGQEQRVVAPPSLAQRVPHLRPDVLVPYAVFGQPIGPAGSEETDAFHGPPFAYPAPPFRPGRALWWGPVAPPCGRPAAAPCG